jgi:hypothetical protein
VKTEDLITLIAQDTRQPVNLTSVLSGAVVAGSLVSGLAFFLTLGFRHDIGQAIETVRFGFKVSAHFHAPFLDDASAA